MTETEPLTREQLERLRDGTWPPVMKTWPDGFKALADTALYYEARLREVEAERDRLQEWTDRVAQTSTDAATAAEKAEAAYEGLMKHTGKVEELALKAEARVAELEEKANNYDKIIKIANEDSLASDGLEMIFAAMREDKEEN